MKYTGVMNPSKEPTYFKAAHLQDALFRTLRETIAMRCSVQEAENLPSPEIIGLPADEEIISTLLSFKHEHGLDDETWAYILQLLSHSGESNLEMWKGFIESEQSVLLWNQKLRRILIKIRMGWFLPEKADQETRKSIATALIEKTAHEMICRIVSNLTET